MNLWIFPDNKEVENYFAKGDYLYFIEMRSSGSCVGRIITTVHRLTKAASRSVQLGSWSQIERFIFNTDKR